MAGSQPSSEPWILPALGTVPADMQRYLLPLDETHDGLWRVGANGVQLIFTPLDRKVEFIVFEDKTVAFVKSAMGYPAMYPVQEVQFKAPAEAVLMDLDGTSVYSEHFWVWVIEQVTARLVQEPDFKLEAEDEPHVSGHSVSEHLQYCIDKYAPAASVEEARKHYFEITHYELNEILEGRGKQDAFEPSPDLKEFLLTLKKHQVKIGLVTSGLYEKAWPEILSAFRQLDLGDPKEFYDAIVTAGFPMRDGEPGTLGELSPKPHPWLYAETARVGLGIPTSRRHKVVGIEDSGAGVLSIRLAGFPVLGVGGGNIERSGSKPFLHSYHASLMDALPDILG